MLDSLNHFTHTLVASNLALAGIAVGVALFAAREYRQTQDQSYRLVTGIIIVAGAALVLVPIGAMLTHYSVTPCQSGRLLLGSYLGGATAIGYSALKLL